MITPKDIIDDLFVKVNNLVSSSSPIDRSTEPYYVYGRKQFETNEGIYPQVRVRPQNWTLEPRNQGTNINPDILYVSGSVATMRVNMLFSIWGEDEEEVLKEFRLILMGIRQQLGVQNPSLISQGSYEGLLGNWNEVTDINQSGNSMTFNWTVRLNIPEYGVDYATVLTSSTDVSGSGEYLATETLLSSSL